MTEEQLKEIEARANSATKGPWSVKWANATSGDVVGPMGEETVQRNLGGRAQYAEVDAAFIAHAREDVPALVAEVRRLRTALTQIVGPPEDGCDICVVTADEPRKHEERCPIGIAMEALR